MPPKKYYAIARGRTTGIYTNWPAAKAQIEGFHGAVYKGFLTREEAAEWLAASASARQSRISESPPASGGDENGVIIYTDGGCRGNPGPGGYGIIQVHAGEKKELSGGFRLTTNNRMELMAVIVALKNLVRRDVPVTIYTDSSYVVNGIVKGWAKSWRKNNWIKSDKNPALNADLWAELLDLLSPLKATFRWVKGHAGNPFNERCDQLAVAEAGKKNLPADTGYE